MERRGAGGEQLQLVKREWRSVDLVDVQEQDPIQLSAYITDGYRTEEEGLGPRCVLLELQLVALVSIVRVVALDDVQVRPDPQERVEDAGPG